MTTAWNRNAIYAFLLLVLAGCTIVLTPSATTLLSAFSEQQVQLIWQVKLLAAAAFSLGALYLGVSAARGVIPPMRGRWLGIITAILSVFVFIVAVFGFFT